MTTRTHSAAPRPRLGCRAAIGALTVLALGLPALGAELAATRGVLEWVTGTVVTPQQDATQIAQALTGTTRGGAHFVIQFARPLTDAERQDAEENGLRLLNYVGDNAFFATTSAGVRGAALAETGAVRCVLPIETEWKLDPVIQSRQWPDWAIVSRPKEGAPPPTEVRVAAYVAFHPDVPLSDGEKLAWAYGAEVRSALRSINALVVEMPANNVAALGAEDSVEWIEPPLPALSNCNDSNRARVGADILQAAPYGLDGSGVSVLVYDGGTGLAGHQDFGGRLHVRDTSGTAEHSTHVAGTIGGSGAASSGLRKGMAPAVTIESYGFEQAGGLQEGFLYTDPGDLEADYSQAINTYGVDIANNSIGSNTAPNGFDCNSEGNYGLCSQLIDTIVRGDGSNPLFTAPFRVVWANGNERQVSRCLGLEGFQSPYHSTAPPACAKNHITVGALNSNDDSVTSFTSFGPTDDGRLKPDISGPGCQSNDDNGVTSCSSSGTSSYTTMCGTSMASPTVCGVGALLLQDYRAHYPTRPDFRNSTLKVFLAHTAVDLFNPGPDYQTGYGSIRAAAAVDLMRSGNFLENQVSQGQIFRAVAVVTPGQAQLKVTLAWDDYPAAPNASPVLVNDLDLRVFDAANNQYYPWTLNPANPSAAAARTQADHVNNIEQVVIDNPPAGGYRIEVYGYNVPQGPQPFSLAATPQLVNCSSQGTATLDHPKYACASTATLSVVDCDLNTNSNVVETVLVAISSTSEPTGESVLLTETSAESAAFLGSIPLSMTNAPGVLLVSPGDTITLTYNDANNGSGQPAVVTATAVVDCTPPVISGVNVAPVNPRDATINLTTNEAAQITVRYGLSCNNLTQTVPVGGYRTTHTVSLTGLSVNTTYFFVIDAVDQAGNAITDNNGGACYSFATPAVPDFFTEIYASSDNDLDNLSLIFTPNGSNSFYRGCVETITALPTDPAGGTTLSLADDSFATVALTGGAHVSLYGVNYTTMYVGSNGYVTFYTGDSTTTESLTAHFNQPRISALFDDLNPAAGGQVSWKQLSDRVAVTWLNVPEWNVSNQNTLQIEMFFDGRIKLNYLAIAATDGLAGLSAGAGVSPDFSETDLSMMGACGPRPPTANGVAIATPVSVPVLVTLNVTDDGLPNPPGIVTCIITGLPSHGALSDAQGGAITTVPYTLANHGNHVLYTPQAGYHSTDTFLYKGNDGGVPPEGGDSNAGTVTVTLGGPLFDPVANNATLTTPIGAPVNITLSATDPNGDPLTYVIESLPASGYLTDPGAGIITQVPYTLVSAGNVVRYYPPSGQNPTVTFTFTAHDATAGSNVATVTVTVGGPQLVHSFPLDTNPGWTTQGLWAWGHPTGGSGDHGGPDPTDGHTGTNVYGYNLSGGYTNGMAETHLTTTALNCANVTGAHLKFWRWLGIERSTYDHAYVRVSNDGSTWTTVWQNTDTTMSETAWSAQDYDISAVADNHATVYIRWTMGATDGSWTFCGWNIDDIEIWGLVPYVPTVCRGDCDCNGQVGFSDIDYFVAGIPDNQVAWANLYAERHGGQPPSCTFANCDANGDGHVNFADIDPFVALIPSACP